jgi:hypothetical protein
LTLPPKTGHFSIDRVEHARQRDIDAEERLAGDDGVGVNAGLGLANDGVVFRVFERDLVEDRAGQRGGFGGQLSISEGFAGGLVQDAAGLGAALGEGNSPDCRSRGYEHLAAGRSYAAQRIPGLGSGGAAAGGLAAVGGLVEVSLLHADALPVDVELFGDEHGQLGLDALAHFGSAGLDGDGAVGGDFDEGGRLQVRLFGSLGVGGRDVETEGEASAGQGADFQKGSAVNDRLFMGWSPLAGERGCRSLADGLANAWVGSATAKVAAHGGVDFLIGGVRGVG